MKLWLEIHSHTKIMITNLVVFVHNNITPSKRTPKSFINTGPGLVLLTKTKTIKTHYLK